MIAQNAIELGKEILQILWPIFSGIMTVATAVVAFFLKRLAKQFDELTNAINQFTTFMAVQKVKNEEVEEIKTDLRETQEKVNNHERRIGELEVTNKILNKNGAN